MIIGDSIDVQVATRDVCVFEQRTLGIIVAAKEAKVEVLLDLETKEAFPDYSWYDLGESDMWDMVRKTYSMGPSPTGFVLHHYKVSRLGSLSSILSSFGFNIHSIFLLTIYIYIYMYIYSMCLLLYIILGWNQCGRESMAASGSSQLRFGFLRRMCGM